MYYMNMEMDIGLTGVNLQKLCRLCAKEHNFLKNLLNENNKSISDLIRHFTQITVTECDNMPTNVCLDCEEKLVKFQLFILECYRVQDSLRKLNLKIYNNNIKVENDEIYTGAVVEQDPEVKHETSEEDILGEVANDNLVQIDDKRNILKDILSNIDHDYEGEIKYDINEDDNVREDDEDEISIAKLKEKKGNKSKGKVKKSKPVNNTPRNSRNGKDNTKLADYFDLNCIHCNKLYQDFDRLKRHVSKVHKSRVSVQCKCGYRVFSRSTLYKHYQNHRNPSSMSCDVCLKDYPTEDALKKHKLKHVEPSNRKYECSQCDKWFRTKDCLKSHEKSHIPIEKRRVYGCGLCQLKFTTPSAVKSHIRVVHYKVKAYVCDLCGYATGTSGELRQHRAIHSEEKLFPCRLCPKRFKTYSNMKTHMDTHDSTSYECYICHRVMNTRRTLRKHLLVHDDQCRHVCPFCNKAFKRRQTLKTHMTMHTGDKPLLCKLCGERFAYASTLRSHRLRVHPNQVTAQGATAPYPHDYAENESHNTGTEEYIKNDITTTAMDIPKNEVAAIQ